MLIRPLFLVALCILASAAKSADSRVAKVTLSPPPAESLSEVLFNRWGIGSAASKYRLYGPSGWVEINSSLRSEERTPHVVFIPAELLRPTDEATIGKITDDGQFLPYPPSNPSELTTFTSPNTVASDAEPCPPPKPAPSTEPTTSACDCAPVPLTCTPEEPVVAATVQKAASSYQWEVNGSMAMTQTQTDSQAEASKPIDRQELSGEAVSLYIFGPWSGFFSVGIGPSIAVTSVRTEQSQSISDGFTSEEKTVKTEQSFYSLGIRSHFYFRELGFLNSVPFLGLSYCYSIGTETESGTPDADLSGFSYAGLVGYHIPLLDAVSLSPGLRYDVATLERTSTGETISQTTKGIKFSLGLSVFL